MPGRLTSASPLALVSWYRPGYVFRGMWTRGLGPLFSSFTLSKTYPVLLPYQQLEAGIAVEFACRCKFGDRGFLDRRSKKAGLLSRSGVQDFLFIPSCLTVRTVFTAVGFLAPSCIQCLARTRPILLQAEPMPCNVNWFVPLCRKSAGLGRLCGV